MTLTISSKNSDILERLALVPFTDRFDIAKQLLTGHDKDALIKLISNVIEIANQFSAACLDAVDMHILINSDCHAVRNSFNDLNLPSFSGACRGAKFLKYADENKVCKGCAYRSGTVGNTSSSTLDELEECLEFSKVFYCHESIEDESNIDKSKLRACRGYAQHLKGRELPE
ncbi:hypothetical protein [Acinetobacter ursingii]|uniref:hypothetical protein n=1 Tax=Acinetobacter ursingii TaxID=108980 RepID=UPI00300B8C17